MNFLRYFLSSALVISMVSPLVADDTVVVSVETPSSSTETSESSGDSQEKNNALDNRLPKEIPLPEELKPLPVNASEAEIQKFYAIITNFLASEPGLKALQKAQLFAQYFEAKHELETRHLLDEHKGKLITEEGTIILGNPKGKVTLVLVADPLCANCRVLENILRKVIKQQPSLRVILHQWAFVNPEESSRVARDLQAAYKVDPKSYGKLHEAFLALKEVPDQKTMDDLIKGAKYDLDKVRAVSKSDETQQNIDRVSALAKLLKLPGTPILFAKDPAEEGRLMIIPPVSDKELNEIVTKLAKEDTASLKQDLESTRKNIVAPAA